MDELVFKIKEEDIGVRIDKYLVNVIDGKSRSFIQGLIDSNAIIVNNKEVKSNYKLRNGDVIIVSTPAPAKKKV